MKLCLTVGLTVSGVCASHSASANDLVPTFGANPGKLQMYRHVPPGAPPNAPLVVVLHGCTQSASDMANAGWDTVADAMKIYVAYAQQPSANNPVSCFDWFGQYNNPVDKTNITRGGGESESIKEMVDAMKASFSIDPKRVYVAGFSAGAAMAAVMLAAYPDVFAAGGIAAGVPYDCPSTQNADVFQCMNPGKTLTPDQWGGFVRDAFKGFGGPWPRVTIWQGTSDTTVGTQNSTELVKQWTDVHGIAATPSSKDTIDGYPRSLFTSPSGEVVVEQVAITGMSHGFAVDAAHGCGAVSGYTPDEHVCTARRMAEFFLGAAAPPGGGGGGGSSGGGSGGSGATGGSAGGSGAGAGGGGAGPGAGDGATTADAGDCGSGAEWTAAKNGCGVSPNGAGHGGALASALVGCALALAGRRRR